MSMKITKSKVKLRIVERYALGYTVYMRYDWGRFIGGIQWAYAINAVGKTL